MAATLSSNDDEARFVIVFSAPAHYAHDPGFESSIFLRGSHWDGDHTFPFSTSIEGVWLRTADLKALREHITHWLDQPLECLMAKDLSADFRLACLADQDLSVRFRPHPDMTSELNPVVSITFSAGVLQGRFHFVTDQSCLTLFAQELGNEMRGK
jgi:hypothetical protein